MIGVPMDESTQLNHWIALMAELEEAREKIGKAVYKHYKAGRLADDSCLDVCRRIDDLYKEAKEYESFLQEDFKVFTEDKAQSGKLAQKATAKAAGFISKLYIKHQVSSYKRNFRDQFLELGSRVVGQASDGRVVCNVPAVLEWCRYAAKVQKESDMRWEEICILHREQVKGNAFLATFKQFVVNFSNFARSNGGPLVQKLMGHNQNMVNQLRSQYRKKMEGESKA